MGGELYGGIDPGKSGAIVLLSDHGIVDSIRFAKTTLQEIAAFLWAYQPSIDITILEKVSSGGGSGRRPGATSMFNFGRSFGWAEAFLAGIGIPYEYRTPGKWQKPMGIHYKAEWSRTERKNHTKQRAINLFPTFPVTHAEADAILIAEYCRRWRKGVL